MKNTIKVNIMKTAHQMTRTSVKTYGGDYRATFAVSLKMVHAEINNRKKYPHSNSDLINKMEILGNEVWKNACEFNHKKEESESGIKEMHYSEYKNNYSDCKTVAGSYDKKTKTIKVYVGKQTTAANGKTVESKELVNTNYGFVLVTHYTDGTYSRSIAQ